MLACRVLIGDIAKGKRNCDPPLKSDGNTRVETLVNHINNPTIFVATRDYVALPCYYIWFGEVSSKTNSNSDSIPKANISTIATTTTSNNSPPGSTTIYAVGSKIDCLDTELKKPKWYPARVIKIDEFNNTVLIKYVGYNNTYNRWISRDSTRLAPRGIHTNKHKQTKDKKHQKTETLVINIKNPIKEGWLEKQSRYFRVWRRRWIVLDGSKIYSFKNERKYENPTEIIDLKLFSSVKSSEDQTQKQYSFDIYSPEMRFSMVAQTQNEKEDWIRYIGLAMVSVFKTQY